MNIEDFELIQQLDGLSGNDLIHYIEKYIDRIKELEVIVNRRNQEIDKLNRSLEIIKNICVI